MKRWAFVGLTEAEEGFVYVNGVGVYGIYEIVESENKPGGYGKSYREMIELRERIDAILPTIPPGYEPHWEECPAHDLTGWYFAGGRFLSGKDLERYQRIGKLDFPK